MQITTINYTKTFNLGSYQSEKIGVEISLNEGEDAKEALNTAKNLVHEYYMEGQPPQQFVTQGADNPPVKEVQVDKEPETKLTKEERQKEMIMACTEIEGKDGLKSFAKLVASYPYLQPVYDETMQKLTDGAK